jgi:hypothetical protein
MIEGAGARIEKVQLISRGPSAVMIMFSGCRHGTAVPRVLQALD